MSAPPSIILASSSAGRARLLTQAGVPFTQISPDPNVEEAAKAAIDTPMSAADMAIYLATVKAASISKRYPNALVIGADQIMTLDTGEILEKPLTIAAARYQLIRLRNQTHTLETVVVLVQNGRVLWSDRASPKIRLRAFSDAFLEQYLVAAKPDFVYCVGSYQIEDIGIQLVDRIDGDYFTIQGLAILPLLQALRQFKGIES